MAEREKETFEEFRENYKGFIGKKEKLYLFKNQTVQIL